LPYLPFALWDPRGLINNVVLYSLTRDTDSTALAHYLPTWGRFALIAVVGCALLWVWRRTQREGWNALATTRFIFISHLGVLIASGYLHNNYMTWLSPVIAIYTFQITVAARATPGQTREPGADWAP